MKDDNQKLDAATEAMSAFIDTNEDVNSPRYRELHNMREFIQIARADASDYTDSQFGVFEDILSRAINTINARKSRKCFGCENEWHAEHYHSCNAGQ